MAMNVIGYRSRLTRFRCPPCTFVSNASTIPAISVPPETPEPISFRRSDVSSAWLRKGSRWHRSNLVRRPPTKVLLGKFNHIT